MMTSDDGLSPVIAIVMLIGMVALAGAIIGISMFSALESASGTAPDIQFRISGDNRSLYHAGGDVLYKKDLMFYDTEKFTSGMDSTAANVTGSVQVNGKQDWSVWQTGDVLTLAKGSLSMLSIVGRDSRGHPTLLYLGSDAMILPLGEMVPDVWQGEIHDEQKRKPGDVYNFTQITSWSTVENNESVQLTPGIYRDDDESFYAYLSESWRGSTTTFTSLKDFVFRNSDVSGKMYVLGFPYVKRSGDSSEGGLQDVTNGVMFQSDTGILYVWTGGGDGSSQNALPQPDSPGNWVKIGSLNV